MFYFYEKLENNIFNNINENINEYLKFIFSNSTEGLDYNVEFNRIYKNILPTLNNCFRELRTIYFSLTIIEKEKIEEAFDKNQNMKKMCEGFRPIKYSELNQGFAEQLRILYNYLYDDFFALDSNKLLKKQYYEKFAIINIDSRAICPCCGIEKLEYSTSTIRDDFDHYFLKNEYPFMSILSDNLIPICKKCNQLFKRQKDLGGYERVFYPFNSITIDFAIKYTGDTIKIEHISFIVEIESWDDIFNVKSRLFDIINNEKNDWLENDVDCLNDLTGSQNSFLEKKISQYSCGEKIKDFRFLKKSFYEYLLGGEK